MNFLLSVDVYDKKNKAWGNGKIISVNENDKALTVFFPGKTGLKVQKYSYPLDFEKKFGLRGDDEELKQRIIEDIWFEKAEKESLAFKYNYCDGGSNESKVGFSGVCSYECILKNIENAGRAWCSISPCSDYQKKRKTREEIEKEYEDGRFFCYESRLLTTWKAGIGVDNDGRPRRIGSDVRNGLAIMTSVNEKGDEKNRYIFAVFLIRSQEFGNEESEGFVSADDGVHPRYAICLSNSEASKLKFWDYYSNPNEPTKILWGTGLYRFVSHMRAARILKDIINVKKDPEGKAHAKELLDLFCKLHDISEIPEKDGALTMITAR